MGVGISSMVFASNTVPTDFGLVLAAIAGAGSLLLIALRFVPEAKSSKFIYKNSYSGDLSPIDFLWKFPISF